MAYDTAQRLRLPGPETEKCFLSDLELGYPCNIQVGRH